MKYEISREEAAKIALDLFEVKKILDDYVRIGVKSKRRNFIADASEVMKSLVVAEHYFRCGSEGKLGVAITLTVEEEKTS